MKQWDWVYVAVFLVTLLVIEEICSGMIACDRFDTCMRFAKDAAAFAKQ